MTFSVEQAEALRAKITLVNITEWVAPGTGSTVASLEGQVIAATATGANFAKAKGAIAHLQKLHAAKGAEYRTNLLSRPGMLTSYDVERCGYVE